MVTGWTNDNFEKAAQNPTQHMHVMPRIDSQPQNTAYEKRPVLPSNASSRDTMQASQVGDEGLRPISFESLKTGLLYTFQKPSVSKSVSTPTLSGFTAMVAKKWRGLSDAEKGVLVKLLECQ